MTTNTLPIKVIVADDHPIVCSGIVNELKRYSDINVIATAADGKEALEKTNHYRPDVLVLDINMPKMTGVEVLEKLHESAANMYSPATLILSAHCDPEYVFQLFAVGAKGYLLKDEPPSRIVDGVRRIMAGDPALSLPVQKALLRRSPAPAHELSSRELEVLRLIAKGYTNPEIAKELVIAEGTVKNHVTNIYRKLPHIKTRSEAVAWAWENRIVYI